MPNLRNAKKALRQDLKRTQRNLEKKVAFKKAIKTVQKAISSGESDIAAKIQIAQKTLDKAAKHGIIKKNTAARRLSRLTKKANSAKK